MTFVLLTKVSVESMDQWHQNHPEIYICVPQWQQKLHLFWWDLRIYLLVFPDDTAIDKIQ